jgi:hypothetical protein
MHRLQFEEGGYFHLELRCSGEAATDGMCSKCVDRSVRTRERVVGARLTKGQVDQVLHGLVTEPIPEWSHIFEGPWFDKQLKRGCTVSEDTMVRAKKAQAAARDGALEKFLCERPPGPLIAPAAEAPAAAAAAEPQPKKKPVVKRTKKTVMVTPPMPAPIARVESAEVIEATEVIEIRVRPFEHSGHSYYIGPSGKLYSKQLKYVGRWNNRENCIDTYPDSD